MGKKITRPDGLTVKAYAPGDGNLSFVVTDGRQAVGKSHTITEQEAQELCPYGWILYREGPNWRARPAQ